MELIKKAQGISPYANACDPLCDGQCSCKSKSTGCSGIQFCIGTAAKIG